MSAFSVGVTRDWHSTDRIGAVSNTNRTLYHTTQLPIFNHHYNIPYCSRLCLSIECQPVSQWRLGEEWHSQKRRLRLDTAAGVITH